MLTGDNADTARSIAADLGGLEFKAELMPQDKLAVVKELQSRYGKVAMVGDGVNDAPALATADMGKQGAGGSPGSGKRRDGSPASCFRPLPKERGTVPALPQGGRRFPCPRKRRL
jgi:magnesium-transporting ATPase (P-type)